MPFEGEYGETELVAVSLAELAVADRLEQQGKMGKLWGFPSECFIEKDVEWGRGQPFLAADNVADFHEVVVDDVCLPVGVFKLVGELSAGQQQHPRDAYRAGGLQGQIGRAHV